MLFTCVLPPETEQIVKQPLISYKWLYNTIFVYDVFIFSLPARNPDVWDGPQAWGRGSGLACHPIKICSWKPTRKQTSTQTHDHQWKMFHVVLCFMFFACCLPQETVDIVKNTHKCAVRYNTQLHMFCDFNTVSGFLQENLMCGMGPKLEAEALDWPAIPSTYLPGNRKHTKNVKQIIRCHKLRIILRVLHVSATRNRTHRKQTIQCCKIQCTSIFLLFVHLFWFPARKSDVWDGPHAWARCPGWA